ncbi:uncharacterized protein [Solanum lycopersicum]|uniref:uncharacterized protein n=1 Tax=Solanum lycopersicum TaxID=4081 RepID=UPI003749F14A
MGSVAHVEEERKELVKDFHRLARLGVRLMSISYSGVPVQNGAESSLVVEVKEKQDTDSILLEHKGADHNQRMEVFSQGGDGVLRYQDRLCVPCVGELRQHILVEAHKFRHSIHPGSTKMYRDMQDVYWWNGIKRDLADFVASVVLLESVDVKDRVSYEDVPVEFLDRKVRRFRNKDFASVKVLSLMAPKQDRVYARGRSKSVAPSAQLVICSDDEHDS